MKRIHIALGATAALSLALLTGCGSDSSSTSAESGAASAASGTASAGTSATTSPGAMSSKATGEGTPVPADQLSALVSDRTFSGNDDGAPYAEYYAVDGTITGVQDGAKYGGTWRVSGSELCFTYEDTELASLPPDASPSASASEDCYTANIDGSTVYWYSDGDLLYMADFVEGNPKGL